MTAAIAEGSPPVSVVTGLYLRTKTLHAEAERSGIIKDLLRGQASRDGYVLLIRNLLPAYREMEQGLHRHKASPALSRLASFKLDRAPAIEADLDSLCGHGWRDAIPVLEAATAYAARIARAAEGDGTRLIAHAYARYLGDLSGGLILQKLLTRTLMMSPSELSFYEFSQFSDLGALKTEYRNALDRAASNAADPDAIIEEGAVAFSHNIDLSWAVQKALAPEQLASTAAN